MGIDIENTSKEGLEDLLSLERYGTAEVFVYHNEESGVTFHPKVYLFRKGDVAKLIVGSNNLTEGGLFANTEAALELEAPIGDEVVTKALATLASWRDPSANLAQRLTRTFLRDLVDEGYVLSEAVLRRRTWGARRDGRGRRARRSLFGRQKVSRPKRPLKRRRPVRRAPRGAAQVGKELLMRLRKASLTERPTQTQVPKGVFSDPFFSGVSSITSAHDRRSHKISRASARGIVNTLKLEIPEMRDFSDPVIRLQRTPSGIVYEAFDASSQLGRPILAALERGRSMSPPATEMTKPSSPATSTWWRFV